MSNACVPPPPPRRWSARCCEDPRNLCRAPARAGSALRGAFAFALTVVVGIVCAAPPADAIPAFARRYETSCTTCHQYHYPRLNSFGRQFRENGYQWPGGGEDTARATRNLEPGTPLEGLSIFKEVPISMRGQVFGILRPAEGFQEQLSQVAGPAQGLIGPGQDGKLNSDMSIYSFIIGGGTIAKDVSYFFTWTPFPDPGIHQARIGLHNIFSSFLGEGTLNVRAGALFLLDFQRPGHRFLSALPSAASSVSVGQNRFTWDEATVGVQVYGRPLWGPFHYELALVAGDPGDEGFERDNWKDVFGRMSYILFQNTSYETRLGVFGYVGNSFIQSNQGGVQLQQNDTFGMGGGDLELDIGSVNFFAMGYGSYHSDPYADGSAGSYIATREQLLWAITDNWFIGARHEFVGSLNDASLNRNEIGPHLTYAISTNVLVTGVWRQSLIALDQSSGIVALDVSF